MGVFGKMRVYSPPFRKLTQISVTLLAVVNAFFSIQISHAQSALETELDDRRELDSLIDPFDPFDFGDTDTLSSEKDDSAKSAETLLREATNLLVSERPLDARTKLLRALKRDPNLYRTHFLLAGYYLIHVGHFRLALKYIKRAEQLFEESHGRPPYKDYTLQLEHANIIYYQSQIRLSLDNYPGALESLDRYAALGYVSDWYPGSRAWILMKLGRIQEAIAVARAGILANADPSRTLNMLGILLSMNGQPNEALDVFRKAIAQEFSAGDGGQPATPLNNSGEVYKELFDDDRAESSFLRAVSLPDGCEHVLPSLNLALLYVDQLKLEAAKSALDGFERCVAQFPLRNNEEHIALVHLARGRIDLHSGKISGALDHLRSALDGTQWFGKIGTNQNDLLVAATISLAQALKRHNEILSTTLSPTWSEVFSNLKLRATNSIESWWLFRRARQMLVGELNDIEDLQIRNTDSLLEYPTLGETLKGFSDRSLARRLERESDADNRAAAKLFYKLYGAEGRIGIWTGSATLAELDEVIERARPRYDELLKTHAILLRLAYLSIDSKRYRELAYTVFMTAPALLRNYGFKLPVKIDRASTPSYLTKRVLSGPFVELTDRAISSSGELCVISGAEEFKNGEHDFRLTLYCPNRSGKGLSVNSNSGEAVVNKLAEAAFGGSNP